MKIEEFPAGEEHIAEFIPERLKVLVFDVDDTVTRGTLGIKIETFKQLFSDRLDRLQEGRECYEFTGKGDRYNIIAHIIDEPQEGCQENELVEKWAQKFEVATMKAIRKQGIHPDDVGALVALRKSFNGPMYLLSATPQNSVAGNMKYFQAQYPELQGMFKEIIGNPMNGGKAGELGRIAEEYRCAIEQVLMVGDGGSDYNGAKGSGSQFVGIVPVKNADTWSDKDFPKLSAISGLHGLLFNNQVLET